MREDPGKETVDPEGDIHHRLDANPCPDLDGAQVVRVDVLKWWQRIKKLLTRWL